MKPMFRFGSLIILILTCLTACSRSGIYRSGGESAEKPYELGQAITMEALTPFSASYMDRLKTKYQLETFISETGSQFETVQAVSGWVSGLWEHDGGNTPSKNDPMTILDEVTEEGQRFRCVEYGTVIYGCLNALGIPSRPLNLKTEDVETRESGAGHVVTEVYLEDLNKWIFVDGQWGMIPVLNDVPLNGLEFSEALKEKEKLGNSLDVICLLPESGVEKEEYFRWIEEYLYFFDFTYWQEDSKGKQKATKVMLTPEGVKNPKIFQVKYNLNIDIYTHSAEDFYPPVRK